MDGPLLIPQNRTALDLNFFCFCSGSTWSERRHFCTHRKHCIQAKYEKKRLTTAQNRRVYFIAIMKITTKCGTFRKFNIQLIIILFITIFFPKREFLKNSVIFWLFLHVSKSQYFFSNLNSNCSNILDLRNLLEQVKKSLLLPKIVLTFHCLNKLF